jgi:PAS domain S-box-containing protein
MTPVVSGKPDGSKACCVRGRTDGELAAEYLVAMKTIQTTQPDDLKLAVHVSHGDTYEWSKVLLARTNPNGTLELLTAAWEKVLGYGRQEFVGKTLRQLMRSSKEAAARTVAAILDERNMDPVELTVRSRGGEAKCLRLHRRHDAYTRKIFIVAEETSASESSHIPDYDAVRTGSVASGMR